MTHRLPACLIAIVVSFALGAPISGDFFLPRALAQTITFDPNTNSVLDADAELEVLDPEPNTITTLHTDGGGQYYVWFSADHPGFALGAETRGIAPCDDDVDTGKGDAQLVRVLVDNGPARTMTMGDSIKVPVTSFADNGPHTLRAFMLRSWDESLKDLAAPQATRETELYCIRTFYVNTNNGAHEVDSTLPLLSLCAPLETFNGGTYPSDQVPLDFYMTFRGFTHGYRLEVTLKDSISTVLARDTLDQWAPHCISGLADPEVGTLNRYTLRARILTTGGSPVSNGARYELNDVTHEFYVRRK